MLDWIKNPDLRRCAPLGLNKGEARNALARAVYFCRLGEMRDRTFENQFFRASGLNLLVPYPPLAYVQDTVVKTGKARILPGLEAERFLGDRLSINGAPAEATDRAEKKQAVVLPGIKPFLKSDFVNPP